MWTSFKNKYQTISKNQLILLLILLVGSILRCYNLQKLPFSHDELSAILRTNFSNFHELIELGVKSDFHPAGIQVFLFYWIKIVGTTEWLIKLPFVIVSIASISLIYKIGQKWKNETVGLIAAAFLATSQIAIYHGTSARPYATGLFFILLMFNALLAIKNNPERKNWKYWVFFILGGTLAAYNHHVSALVAGLIGLIGLIIIHNSIRKRYLLAGIIICLLYLPHFPILSYQLSKGGIGGENGWLGAPDYYFFQDYFYYLFHYSIYPIILSCLLILVGLYYRLINGTYLKMLMISCLLFFIPLFITFFYSVYVNPILQFSILIFSHFFLYFILFGHFKNVSTRFNFIIVVAILSVMSTTLIFQRKHYELNYQSIYMHVVDDLKELRIENNSLPAIVNCRWDFRTFYAQRNGTEPTYVKYDSFEIRNELLNYLDSISITTDSLYIADDAHLPYFVIPDAQRFFPVIKAQRNYIGGSTYLLTKKGVRLATKFNYSSNKSWQEINGKKLALSEDGYYKIDSTIEFGPSLSIPLIEVISHPSNYVDVHVPLIPDSLMKDVILVCELMVDGKSIQWEGSSSETQKPNGICNELITTFKVGKFRNYSNGILKVYLWNPNHSEIQFKDIKLSERKGNRIIYGLVDRIIP